MRSLSIRPSYGVRGEEIFRFHFSPFPQKRLILRLVNAEIISVNNVIERTIL